VREIFLLHTTDIRAKLPRRQDDGQWPDEPSLLRVGDAVHLETIGFAGPLAAFYRTSGLA
jgi:hypothetical protein